jgi:hypothetical protein
MYTPEFLRDCVGQTTEKCKVALKEINDQKELKKCVADNSSSARCLELQENDFNVKKYNNCVKSNSKSDTCATIITAKITKKSEQNKEKSSFCETQEDGIFINKNNNRCKSVSAVCANSSETVDCGTSTDSELEPTMDASGECVHLKEIQAKIEASKAWTSVIGGFTNPIAGITNAIKGDADNLQEINTILSTSVTSKQISVAEQKCQNEVNTVQSNVIKGYGPICLENIMSGNLESKHKLEYLKSLKTNISGVTQSNDSGSYSDCLASSMVDLFASASSDVNNTAFQKALATSKGILSSASNNQKGCSDIRSDITACQYVKSQQCCSNILNTDQSNNIDAACSTSFIAQDIIQKNKAIAYAACSLTSETAMSADLIAKITNRQSQDAEAKSEGFDLNSFFNAMALAYIFTIVGGIGGTSLLGYGLLKSKGLLVIVAAIVLIAIGVGNLVVYYSQKNNEADVIYEDSCRSICDDVLSEPNIRQSTYKNAREYAKQIKAVGFDFFVSEVLSKGSEFKIQDSTEGRAIFITKLPDDIDYKDDCDNFESVKKAGLGDLASRTTIFGEKASPILLGLGVTCVVLGVVCFGVGGYLMYIQGKKNKQNKQNKQENQPETQLEA